MNTTKYLLISIILLLSNQVLSQSEGTILVISNTKAKVLVDGEEVGHIDPNKPKKFGISPGQHYL